MGGLYLYLPSLATDFCLETDPQWGRRVEVLPLDGLNSMGVSSLITKATKSLFFR